MIEVDGGIYKEGDIILVNYSFYYIDVFLIDKVDVVIFIFENFEIFEVRN